MQAQVGGLHNLKAQSMYIAVVMTLVLPWNDVPGFYLCLCLCKYSKFLPAEYCFSFGMLMD
jgi:hypothetical protein